MTMIPLVRNLLNTQFVGTFETQYDPKEKITNGVLGQSYSNTYPTIIILNMRQISVGQGSHFN